MSTQSKTYTYSVYEALLQIEEGDHQEQVRFVEKNLLALRQLDLEEYFEMLCRYHCALFETGTHLKQLKIADEILELSIVHNLEFWNGEDIYFETLFKKAATFYNTDRFTEAQYILKELLKIQPNHEPSKLFLINTLVLDQKKESAPFRSFSIGAILASAVVIALELIVVRPYFQEMTDFVELSRNTLFGIGVVSLIAGEVYIRYKAVEKALELIHYYKERKRGL